MKKVEAPASHPATNRPGQYDGNFGCFLVIGGQKARLFLFNFIWR
jgi:hypothetical protein